MNLRLFPGLEDCARSGAAARWHWRRPCWSPAVAVVVAGSGGGGGGVTTVTISGKATYQRVPFSTNVNLGLSYASTSEQPIREAIVELIQSGGSTLATTTTDSNGNYALTAPANTSVFVRVQAQSRKTTTPARNIRVLNNTNGNALYVLDSAVVQFRDGEPDEEPARRLGLGWHELHRHAQRSPVCDPRHAAGGGAIRRRQRQLDARPAGARCVLEPAEQFVVGRRDAGPDRIHPVYAPHRPADPRRASMCSAPKTSTRTNTTSTCWHTSSSISSKTRSVAPIRRAARIRRMIGSTCGLPSAKVLPTRSRRWC